jgi:hypothetical protein
MGTVPLNSLCYINNFILEAQNRPWWKYLHLGHWQMLSIRISMYHSFLRAGKPLPAHHLIQLKKCKNTFLQNILQYCLNSCLK